MTHQVIENWKNDLSAEKNFFAVISVSWRDVGDKKDAYFSVAALIICIAISLFIYNKYPYRLNAPLASALVVQWSAMGISLSSSILGFIIAGFSIFSTMTDRKLFQILSKIKKKDRNISEFKFVFYNFLYVFAHYLAYLLMCIIVLLLASKGSPVWRLAKDAYPNSNVDLCAVILCSVVGVYTVHVVLVLKTFIWNLYQSILFAIFHDANAD